jgi:hypothetical protein
MTQQQNPQRGLEPKPLIIEGAKPKWEKPFCWKCMRHTPYKRETSTRQYKECKICGSKGMHAPADFDYYHAYGMQPRMFPFAIGCFLVLPLLFICPIIFIILTENSKAERETMYVLLIIVSVFFYGLYGGIFLWTKSKYRAWKKWARLRGWEGLTKSERIKMGAKKR